MDSHDKKVLRILTILFTCMIFMIARSCYSQTNVTATVYNAVPSQCNSDYLRTAFMFKLDSINQYKHKIIAVSRDLLKEYPKGTKVYINGTSYDGIYTVMDKMNRRWKNRIDILINLDMPIGKWHNVKLLKIK